jgi:hypothetical protein
VLIFDESFPPLAIAECGFSGEFGFIPTTYGTRGPLGKLGRNRAETRHTRHRVFTEEVVDLTLSKLLDL